MMTVSKAAKKWSAETGRRITYRRVMEWIAEGRVSSTRVQQIHGDAIMVLDADPPAPAAAPIPSQKGRARKARSVEVAESAEVAEVDDSSSSDPVDESDLVLPSPTDTTTCTVCGGALGASDDVLEFEGADGQPAAAHAACLD